MCIILIERWEIIKPKEGVDNYLKQRDLAKKLEKAGFVFERHGSNHDIYVRGTEKEEVPRHKDVNEKLAKAILRRRGLL